MEREREKDGTRSCWVKASSMVQSVFSSEEERYRGSVRDESDEERGGDCERADGIYEAREGHFDEHHAPVRGKVTI